MSGDFSPWINRIPWRIIVEVEIFDDGSGANSVLEGEWIDVPHCKSGTTSTTEPATTTTVPVTQSAEVSAACVLDGDTATYPITVTVNGEEGATGTVTINGVDTAYVIDADRSIEVNANGAPGDNTVVVTDDEAGEILNQVLALEDCTPATTTTTQPTTTTTAPTTTTQGTTTTTQATTTITTPTTTTTESSSQTSTPPVSVLPTDLDQTELPQTGIDNGPLAGVGIGLVLTGAGLLVATRREEGLSS